MHLTERALALAVVAALVAFAGLWLPSTGLQRLAGGLLVLLFAGLAIEARGRRARAPVVHVPALRGALGRRLEVPIEWRNPGARPLAFEFVALPPAGFDGEAGIRSTTLPPGGVHVDAEVWLPKRLGRAPFPPLRHRTLGPLGLAWWTGELRVDTDVVVGPDLRALDRRHRRGATGGRATRVLAAAGGEIVQLRDYRPGDAERAIDWKATARRDRLVTREFAEDQHVEILLLIDAGARSALEVDGMARLAHYANAAARLAERAALHDDRVGMLACADRVLLRLSPARGRHAYARLRTALEQLASAPAEFDPVAAALEARALVRARSLVCILTDVDEPSSGGPVARAVRLLRTRHQPIVAGVTSAEIARLHDVAPVTRWDAYLGLAADEYATSLQRSAARLRLAGVPVVLARPDGFERAVLEAYDALRARRRV